MESEATESSYVISRQVLFNIWQEANDDSKKRLAVFNHILQELQLEDFRDAIYDDLIKKCAGICKKFKQKWQESHRSLSNFCNKNSTYLKGQFSFNDIMEKVHSIPGTSSQIVTSARGRPKRKFLISSPKTKQRRVQPLLQHTTEEISYAAQVRLRSEGKYAESKVLKEISENTENQGKRKRKTLSEVIKLSADEALASMVRHRLTKKQYISLYRETKQHNAPIYPCYDNVLLAKKRCYPEGISISETVAEIKVDNIIKHTLERLITVQMPVFQSLNISSEESVKLTAVYKWGCDGAAGQSRYKQQFVDSEADEDDSFMFVISFVTLQLLSTDKKTVFWQNYRPSSTRFCRPIKIMLKHESQQLVTEEIEAIKTQIENLQPTVIEIANLVFEINHVFNFTMIDGKICNYLTHQASSKCYICGAKPTEMNHIEKHKHRVVDESALSFGISSLHAWIRCLECILHIAYRLDIQQWQVQQANKQKVDERKKLIQERLRKELGLLVDIPKPGFGTTNDGNTARRFFSNIDLVSDITGVDKKLIYRLSVILKAISCGLQIDVPKFSEYARETAKIYVEKYNWYYMPPTVHKILIHGGDIITSFIVPIGQLSEEALEARHKECKRFRENSTRKMSRKATMEDLIHMLLVTSDPVINSYIKTQAKSSGPLLPEVIQLLKETPHHTDDTDSE